MVDALRPFDDTLDPQLLAELASSSTKPVELITLRTDDNNRVAPMIGSVPGVVITPQAELLPTDDRFASAVVNQVKKAVIDRIDGVELREIDRRRLGAGDITVKRQDVAGLGDRVDRALRFEGGGIDVREIGVGLDNMPEPVQPEPARLHALEGA